MVRVVEVSNKIPEKEYYEVQCPYCDTKLVTEKSDMWCDDWENKIFRIECPNPRCKSKIHGKLSKYESMPMPIFVESSKDVFDSAIRDTSKSGLQALMDAKKREDDERLRREV